MTLAGRWSLIVVVLFLAGCMRGVSGTHQPALLGPAVMRINPTFTRLTDVGVQADVEMTDAFGDAVKGGGTITFELYAYEPVGPDIRGERIGMPAHFDLSTGGAQRAHWQPIVRTYRFTLPWLDLNARLPYLLLATYDPAADSTAPTTRPAQRLFDRHVIQPPAAADE